VQKKQAFEMKHFSPVPFLAYDHWCVSHVRLPPLTIACFHYTDTIIYFQAPPGTKKEKRSRVGSERQGRKPGPLIRMGEGEWRLTIE
jgi:hypothetical protein